MKRYLILANGWLLVSFILFSGRVMERSEPVRYSFFGIGGWHSATAYHFLVLFSVMLSSLFFFLTWRTRPLFGSVSSPR